MIEKGKRMSIIDKPIEGKELEAFFEEQIGDLKEQFVHFLSQFDKTDLFHKWRELIRHIDELYNITSLTTIEEDELLLRCNINILYEPRFGRVLEIVNNRYGSNVKNRFLKSCIMLSALNLAYAHHGQTWNCTRTLEEAFARCQAMRLYYVTMLLFIPKYCKGRKRVEFIDLLNFFQPMIDMCLVNIRTAYNALMVNHCIDNFKATPHKYGLAFNYDYNHLESEYLEPMRMTIVDVMQNMSDVEKSQLPKDGVKVLYGYEELMQGIALSSAVYDKYGLNEIDTFKQMVGLAEELKGYLRDNYAFIVPEEVFRELMKKYSKLNLICKCDGFDEMLNSRPAFFKFDGYYYSTVLLYQRYMVNEEQRLLEKKKKFQIDSGFVFEKEVKRVLEEFGYDVRCDVKRINRKEFDVVCVKDDCIYNFQCKNNSVGMSLQGEDWFGWTCSAIKRLNRYNEKELSKEDNREELLKQKIGLDTVKSFVISRFPVISKNPRIINFNGLRKFLFMMEKQRAV